MFWNSASRRQKAKTDWDSSHIPVRRYPSAGPRPVRRTVLSIITPATSGAGEGTAPPPEHTTLLQGLPKLPNASKGFHGLPRAATGFHDSSQPTPPQCPHTRTHAHAHIHVRVPCPFPPQGGARHGGWRRSSRRLEALVTAFGGARHGGGRHVNSEGSQRSEGRRLARKCSSTILGETCHIRKGVRVRKVPY